MTEQCAVGLDGQLLNAEHITWYNDPDDKNPIAPPAMQLKQLRHKSLRDKSKLSKMTAILEAEKLDENGAPTRSFRGIRHPHLEKKNHRISANNMESDDNSYSNGSGQESKESSEAGGAEDDEVEITNVELSNILLSKTAPAAVLKAKKATKQKSLSSGLGMSKKSQTPRQAAPLLTKSDSTASVGSLMTKKHNFIYLFFEPVAADTTGGSAPGCKYYKCYHGSRKTFKITPAMKHSIKNMTHHLQTKFPALYCLYMNLNSCDAPLTVLEVLIASASAMLSEEDVNNHLKSLEVGTHSMLQGAFDKQTTATWDQGTFETLLAE